MTTATPLPARIVEDDDFPATLQEAAEQELVWLWGDLAMARRTAHKGCWSIGCENITHRIVALSRLAGPTGWEHVDVQLLRTGLYERIHAEAGLAHAPVDWQAVAACEQRMGWTP